MLHLLKAALKSTLRKSEKNRSTDQFSTSAIPDTTTSSFNSLLQATASEEKAGNKENARRLLYEALEQQPDNVQLLCKLGKLEHKMELYDDAQDNLLTAIHLQPDNILAYLELGNLNIKKNSLDEALSYFEKAHEIEPDSTVPFNGIGNVLLKKLDYENALAAYQKAIDAAPGLSINYTNLGHCYVQMKTYDQAILPLKIAHALDPDQIGPYINLVFIYYTQGKLGKAYRAILKGLSIDPNNETLRWSLSWLLFLFKRFDQAWLEYENRFSSAGGEVVRRTLPLPMWNGEDLAGKTIFIAAEQGLGDQIMFASCLPDLIKQAGSCIVECDKKLAGLMRESFSNIQVFDTQHTNDETVYSLLPQPIDYYTHIGSLPRWLRPDAKSFIPAQAYITAEEHRTQYWQERLSKLGNGLKIGISWRGGAEKTRNFLRSIPLNEWEPILKLPNCQFINLQYGDCARDLHEVLESLNVDIHHWPEAIEDYQETAALIRALDLVVSVCTSLIHLSGALGHHTWVLVPAAPEWRYLAKDESLPWYQNVKLFRQQQLWQWQPVIERVALEITQLQNAQIRNM